MWAGGGDFCPMQDHKFPPDCLFVIYNIGILCLLSFVFENIKIPRLRLLDIWNNRGYTIYLYQSFIYYVLTPVFRYFPSYVDIPLLGFLIMSTVIFLTSTLLSYITYPLEQKVLSIFV